jgi:hypothetical protein
VKKYSVSPPPVGQRFLDEDGVHWTVKNLILSDSLEGFFLASLTHGKEADTVDGTIVVAPLEFEALSRARGMSVVYNPPRPCERINGESEASSLAPAPDALQ